MSNKAIRPKKLDLTGKIINLDKDYLGTKETRFYFVFEDKNGKEVIAFPITGRIDYKDNCFKYPYLECKPKFKKYSLVLTDKEFKYFIEREIALNGFQRIKEYYGIEEFEVVNYKDIFNKIRKYCS